MNRVIRKSERISKTADSILKYKRDSLSIPLKNEDLARMLMRSQSFTVYSTSEGTISDIFGSGKLDIIRNDSVRRAIASWNANLKHLREYEKIEVSTVELYRECIDKYLKLYTQDPQLILDNDNKSKVLNDVVLLNTLTERKFNPRILNKMYKDQLSYLEQLLNVIDNNYK